MSEQEKHHHRIPFVGDKMHLPWQKKHNDDDSPSEKKPHMPWKHHKDDKSGTAAEKQPLLAASSSTLPPASDGSAASKHKDSSSAADKTDDPLTISRTWDVKMPPSKMKMVNGMLVTTMEGTVGALVIRRRRRIAIKIHSEIDANGPPPASLLGEDSTQDENKDHGDSTKDGGKKSDAQDGNKQDDAPLRAGDLVIVNILKPVSKGGKGTLNNVQDRGEHNDADTEAEEWIVDYVFGLENVKITKAHGSHFEVQFGNGDETMVRRVHFSSDKEASSFQHVLEKLNDMEKTLKQERLKNFAKLYPSMVGSDKNNIRLLLEVVSASNLPDIANGVPPNPYVIVTLGSKEIHRTRPIHGSADPIWTVKTGSLCILDVSPEEFFGSAQGLTFFIRNYDAITTNTSLGKVFVSQEKLLKGKGERNVYALEEGRIGTELRPLTQGYNRLVKGGQNFVEGAETEAEKVVIGGERLHPVSDAKKIFQGDSDDEDENDLDKMVLRPARKVQKLIHGEDDGEEAVDLLRVVDPLNLIRKDGNRRRAGKLVLRVRMASDEDVAFMDRLFSDQEKGISGIYSDETFVQPHMSHAGSFRREHRKVDNEKQYRVKPCPDPSQEEATTWMTEAELRTEALKPSYKWVEAGSGDLGKLYVEILGCNGLPNMDSQELATGKTDAFACLVYEDAIVNTEVIPNSLNPWWMPWTQRAFIFNVMHPSSDLLVGVLDYDSPELIARHDPIGRIQMDVSQMRPGTEYIVDFNLYPSAVVKKRDAKGTIKLRLRLELHNERKALLAAMKPPPQIYINVASKRDFMVASFVIKGKYNVNVFNMDLFADYVEQLKGTGLALVPILKDAAYSVVFWRGHYPLRLPVPRFPPLPVTDNASLYSRYTKVITILLPLNSATAFIGGIVLVENYNFLPSFLLFSVAWLFLALSGSISHNPSPWRRQRTFPELMRVLITNSSPVQTIEPNQNIDEIKKYLAKQAASDAKVEEETKIMMEEEAKAQESVGDLDAVKENAKVEMETRTETLGISTNPMEYILWPMQENLRRACQCVYVARSFVIWAECYYAYWIVVGCVVLGLTVLFVPWGWLIQWALRIGVWVFLGPWMKLADMYHTQRNETTDKARQEAEARVKAKYQALLASTDAIRTREEDLTKLKDMENYLFGKYLAVLPRFKQQRHLDVPLSSSYTLPHESGSEQCDISRRVYGQHLTGEMIPKREINQQPKKD